MSFTVPNTRTHTRFSSFPPPEGVIEAILTVTQAVLYCSCPFNGFLAEISEIRKERLRRRGRMVVGGLGEAVFLKRICSVATGKSFAF